MLKNKQEAAEFLNVSPRTIERYVKNKTLKVKQYEQVAGKDSPVFEVVELQRFVSDRDTPKAKAVVVTDSDRKKNKSSEIVVAQTRKITTTTKRFDGTSAEKKRWQETIDRLKQIDPLYDQEFLQRCADSNWLVPTWQLAIVQGRSAKTLNSRKSHQYKGFVCKQEDSCRKEWLWQVVANNQ